MTDFYCCITNHGPQCSRSVNEDTKSKILFGKLPTLISPDLDGVPNGVFLPELLSFSGTQNSFPSADVAYWPVAITGHEYVFKNQTGLLSIFKSGAGLVLCYCDCPWLRGHQSCSPTP
jgi:hypothetical protein